MNIDVNFQEREDRFYIVNDLIFVKDGQDRLHSLPPTRPTTMANKLGNIPINATVSTLATDSCTGFWMHDGDVWIRTEHGNFLSITGEMWCKPIESTDRTCVGISLTINCNTVRKFASVEKYDRWNLWTTNQWIGSGSKTEVIAMAIQKYAEMKECMIISRYSGDPLAITFHCNGFQKVEWI